MRFGQKFAYFACGCAFVVIGQVVTGLVVSRATAQTGTKPSAEFDRLTVRSLQVVDESGNSVAVLEKQKRNDTTDDVLRVFGLDGKPRAGIGVNRNGGDIGVFGNDGKQRAVMIVLKTAAE